LSSKLIKIDYLPSYEGGGGEFKKFIEPTDVMQRELTKGDKLLSLNAITKNV